LQLLPLLRWLFPWAAVLQPMPRTGSLVGHNDGQKKNKKLFVMNNLLPMRDREMPNEDNKSEKRESVEHKFFSRLLTLELVVVLVKLVLLVVWLANRLRTLG